MRLPDGHLVRIPYGAVQRRRPSGRCTPLSYGPYSTYDDCKYSEFGQDLASARQSYFIYVGNDAMIMPSLSNQGWSSQIDYSSDGSSTLTVKKVAQDLG